MIELLVKFRFVDSKLNELKNIGDRYFVSERRYREMESNGIIPKYAERIVSDEPIAENKPFPIKKKKPLKNNSH